MQGPVPLGGRAGGAPHRLAVDLNRVCINCLLRDSARSLSEIVTELVRRGPGLTRPLDIQPHPITGFPVVRLGRPITSEDVRSLDDDE